MFASENVNKNAARRNVHFITKIFTSFFVIVLLRWPVASKKNLFGQRLWRSKETVMSTGNLDLHSVVKVSLGLCKSPSKPIGHNLWKIRTIIFPSLCTNGIGDFKMLILSHKSQSLPPLNYGKFRKKLNWQAKSSRVTRVYFDN